MNSVLFLLAISTHTKWSNICLKSRWNKLSKENEKKEFSDNETMEKKTENYLLFFWFHLSIPVRSNFLHPFVCHTTSTWNAKINCEYLRIALNSRQSVIFCVRYASVESTRICMWNRWKWMKKKWNTLTEWESSLNSHWGHFVCALENDFQLHFYLLLDSLRFSSFTFSIKRYFSVCSLFFFFFYFASCSPFALWFLCFLWSFPFIFQNVSSSKVLNFFLIMRIFRLHISP